MLKITVTSLVNFEIHSAIHHKWPAGYCTDIPSVNCQLWLIEDGHVKWLQKQALIDQLKIDPRTP
jgi:hypothetical protein